MFLETGIGPGLKALKGWSIIHSVTMDGKRDMLRHFLGAIAYRTQKALRAAPSGFGEFEPGGGVRSPRELLRHMRSVLGYARTCFIGGSDSPQVLPTLEDEIAEFNKMVEDMRDQFN